MITAHIIIGANFVNAALDAAMKLDGRTPGVPRIGGMGGNVQTCSIRVPVWISVFTHRVGFPYQFLTWKFGLWVACHMITYYDYM